MEASINQLPNSGVQTMCQLNVDGYANSPVEWLAAAETSAGPVPRLFVRRTLDRSLGLGGGGGKLSEM